MTRKIIQIVIAITIAYLGYRLYCVEQQIEKLEKLEMRCKQPE